MISALFLVFEVLGLDTFSVSDGKVIKNDSLLAERVEKFEELFWYGYMI